MGQLLWSIHLQPNWWQSDQNQSIHQSWAEDAITRDWNVTTSSSIAFRETDELRGYALLRDETHIDLNQPAPITVLSFLLVDLDALPVISTANVAPQQRAWMWKALDSRLAVEIVEKILEMVDGLMDEQESQGH
ncbi:uncharacterized protein C8R40DRAFT_1237916 [Lentinula edodes]|uniref:uncharacterized protein n=1 Tax=Lentinula edodes TaxID=5353 RepID=UPI001E8CC051|nr:uncharacterized protein C8R40DRAFT_1237916 [Lentinula edodes]KAH7874498.1 hypothetical protein C8R40DRAFT_1237916 [Lentinula edodes]